MCHTAAHSPKVNTLLIKTRKILGKRHQHSVLSRVSCGCCLREDLIILLIQYLCSRTRSRSLCAHVLNIQIKTFVIEYPSELAERAHVCLQLGLEFERLFKKQKPPINERWATCITLLLEISNRHILYSWWRLVYPALQKRLAANRFLKTLSLWRSSVAPRLRQQQSKKINYPCSTRATRPTLLI